MTKKHKVLLTLGICLLAIVLLFVFGNRKAVNPFPICRDEVERIELKTYSHSGLPGDKQAELSADEIKRVIRLYNLAGYDPQVIGEPCCDTYWLEIYLKDGTKIEVSQGMRSKMIIRPKGEGDYYLCSRTLVTYVLTLVDTYGLVRD